MENNASISVTMLSKHYRVPVREAGLKASLGSLFKRNFRTVRAVDEISFTVEAGEVVGFLGPNGAGKTTTLKMLSGLLHPTGGECRVLGYEPRQREFPFLGQITLVMGNRSQLTWDLPALDSFELQRAVYAIPRPEFLHRRDSLIEMLELGSLVQKPIRNLSLGERMKMEIVGALLHQPKVLFLDEPTIGLDVTMQRRIRQFIADYNHDSGATVLLTSHYMADVEALCKRVVVIHHGKILFDGNLSALVERFSAYKTLEVTLEDAAQVRELQHYGDILSQADSGAETGKVKLRVPKAQASAITARLLAELAVADLTVENPPVEDVIDEVFSSAPAEQEAA